MLQNEPITTYINCNNGGCQSFKALPWLFTYFSQNLSCNLKQEISWARKKIKHQAALLEKNKVFYWSVQINKYRHSVVLKHLSRLFKAAHLLHALPLQVVRPHQFKVPAVVEQRAGQEGGRKLFVHQHWIPCTTRTYTLHANTVCSDCTSYELFIITTKFIQKKKSQFLLGFRGSF